MKRIVAWATLFAILWASTAQAATLNWSWRNPKLPTNDLWSVTYGDGLFVAVGDWGTILTSPDGVSWRPQESPTLAPLRSVIYAAGRFVAVGGHIPAASGGATDAVVITSPDGRTWSTTYTADDPSLFDITYGQDKFVAVGGCGWPALQSGRAVLTSADGLAWEPRGDPQAEGFCSVAFGNDHFVATAASGHVAVNTSDDGINWTATSSIGDDEMPGWNARGVAFGRGQFVAVQAGARVRTSTDGEHWTIGEFAAGGPLLGKMTTAGDRFFAPGEGIASADGVAWEPLAANGTVLSVGFGAGTYVAVGYGGFIATSADGVAWGTSQPGSMPSLPPLKAIIHAGGEYLAVGQRGLTLESPDGVTWAVTSQDTNVFHDWAAQDFVAIEYRHGRFVALNHNGGRIAASDDGSTWHSVWSTDTWMTGGALLYENGRFMAGTPWGLVTSTDGETWTQVYPGNRLTFTGLIWDGSRYMAAAMDLDEKAFLLTSANGIDWRKQPPETDRITTLAYGNGKYVAVGLRPVENGPPATYLLTSTDGNRWTTGADVAFGYIRYENGLFLGTLGRDDYKSPGALYTSVDGEHWRLQPTPAPVWGAAFQDDRLMLVGKNGAVLFSEPACGTLLDLPANDAACTAVQALVQRKLVSGYPDGTFRPDDPVSRAELAKLVTLVAGKQPQPDRPLPFSDTAGHWAATLGYLQAALVTGAMSGYPNGTFRPDGAVTRVELVRTVLTAAGIQPVDPGAVGYTDIDKSAWYAPWVAAVEQAGLIGPTAHSGLWAGAALEPNQHATRAETALLLQSLLRL